MLATPPPGRYASPLILLHWLTLLLLVAVYALMEFRGIFPSRSAAHLAMKSWHYVAGVAVLGLVIIRVPLRGLFHTPPITPAPAAWQERLAKLMHLTLYAFLLAMPVLGWLALSAKGQPAYVLGMAFPMLIGPDRALGRSLQNIHELIANIGYGLVGLHAAAALFHHYVMRDDTLLRILPRRRRVADAP